MCGRYSFVPKAKQQKTLAEVVQLPAELPLSYNIAPTHEALVIADDHPQQLQRMEWGLVPHWSADGKNSGKLINARAEGIEEKPSFRESILRRHCLVPADSFYEWRKQGARKIPYRIFRKDEQLLFLAGIWDEWKQGGQIKRTFSIITTTPNREMADLHDRMPVIFSTPEECRRWLSPGPLEESLRLLHPPADDLLAMYRVSEKLNKPGYDAPDLQDPQPEEWTLF
ncbi:MAG TPA: SOS response-associated peptidase [Saprospiraceae bacterium]|nr:SOS response-associated peptidase [Saprospiraceae bacterium]